MIENHIEPLVRVKCYSDLSLARECLVNTHDVIACLFKSLLFVFAITCSYMYMYMQVHYNYGIKYKIQHAYENFTNPFGFATISYVEIHTCTFVAPTCIMICWCISNQFSIG